MNEQGNELDQLNTEEKIKALMDSISGGVAIYQWKAGKLETLYYTKGIPGITGHSTEEYQKFIEADTINIIYEGDREVVISVIKKAIAENKDVNVNFRVKHKDGHYVWLHAIGSIVQIENEDIVFQAVLMDVSEQKREEQAIRKKYQEAVEYRRYTQSGNTLLSGHCCAELNRIYEMDDQTGQTLVQQGAEREAFFYSFGQLISDEQERTHFYQMFLKEGILHAYDLGLREQTMECEIVLGKNKRLWVKIQVDMIKDPETKNIQDFLSVLDITETNIQNQIISSVILRDYDYVSNINLKQDQMVMYQKQGKDAKFKDYKAGMVYSYENAVALNAENYVAESDKEMYKAAMKPEHVLEALKTTEVYEFFYHSKYMDDETAVKHIRFTPYDLEKGIVVFSCADVTEMMKEQERQKQQLSQSLEMAKEAAKAKTDFLSRMSHDLRTPMNAIIGLTALTIDAATNPLEVRENMSKMRYASDYMLNLVNDILDMSRLDAGEIEFQREPYAYKEFLASLKTLFLAQARNKGIEIVFQDFQTNPVILADKTRLKQILSNILSNAIKYTPSGGKIEYALENVEIVGKNIQFDFVVKDNGIGMSEEFQKRMFEPFVQEDSTVTAELQGSGLGLSITKNLVENMGGSIEIQSKKGVGTLVRIHMCFQLIREDDMGQFPEVVEEHHREVLHGRNVLLAEDHPLNAEIAKKVLEKQGMHVIHAEDGKCAVELFEASERYHFDAILMDIRMPQMSGIEATKAIRSLNRPDAAHVPIIAMSANAYAADVEKSLEVGMNAHLSKPVNIKLLYETLEKFISGVQRRKPKVLLVDDVATNRAALRANVDEQYEVLEADCGETALKVLQENPDIVCVITDLLMPHMDGKELIRRIRENDAFDGIKIIANTQYGDPDQEEELILLGANEFLYKPISPKVLALRLHNVLR